MKALLTTEHRLANGQINLCVLLAAGILALFLSEYFMIGVQWGLTLLLPATPLIAAQHRLKCRWNRYLLMLPYSRRTVVLSRYLYYLTAALGSAVWLLLLCSLISMFRYTDMPDGFLFRSAVMSLGLILFILALTLPLSFLIDRFEVLWLYGIGIAIFPALFFGSVLMTVMRMFTDPKITASGILKGGVILLLLHAVSLGISLAAYCGGFRRKEADA